MNKCYLCNEILTSSNSSLEHIIPNALGGNLKSRNLLCKKCNSKMGMKEDAKLIGQFELITNLLNIKRDRGKPQSIEVENTRKDENYRLLPGGIPQIIKPKINITYDKEDNLPKSINIVARDKKQAKNVLKGLKRTYNISDNKAQNLLDTFKIEEAPFRENISYRNNFGGENALRASGKIILNFYLFSNQNLCHVKDFIQNYLDKEYDILSNIAFFYPDYIIVERKENEILHSLIVIGDKANNLLYGYLELFNFYKIVVLLNDSYMGEDIKLSYFFDVESREVKYPKFNLSLSTGEIKKYLKQKNKNHKLILDRLILEMNDLMKILSSRHKSILINKIFEDTFNELNIIYTKENYNHLDYEMLDFIIKRVSEKFITYFL